MTGKQLRKLMSVIPDEATDIVIKSRHGCQVYFTLPHTTTELLELEAMTSGLEFYRTAMPRFYGPGYRYSLWIPLL